ncbi:MAG: hypothetical protein V2I33_24250 [Kangiellaceae bacterium]|nr:hypothetical protein [Kangiellaceae bacterium]
MPDSETGLEHIKLTDNEFLNNGALEKAGAIYIGFPRELQNIILSGNTFKDNAIQHVGDSFGIVAIVNETGDLSNV